MRIIRVMVLAMFRREAGQCGNLGGGVNESVQARGHVTRRIEVKVDVRACGRECVNVGAGSDVCCSIETAPLGRKERTNNTTNASTTDNDRRLDRLPIITKKMPTDQTAGAPR